MNIAQQSTNPVEINNSCDTSYIWTGTSVGIRSMYHPYDVSSVSCITRIMYLPYHVSPESCITRIMYLPYHVSPVSCITVSCITRIMYHPPPVVLVLMLAAVLIHQISNERKHPINCVAWKVTWR